MKANTFLLGIVMLFAGLAVFASSWMFSPLPNQSYGSDTMPRVVGVFGILIALALLIEARHEGQHAPRLEILEWLRDPRRVAGMLATVAGVLAYVLLSDKFGFLGVAFPLVFALMVLAKTRVLVALPTAAAAAVAVYLIFGRLLMVPLPGPDFLRF
nr:tripartite tricarboxylate transporter TctB family protein [Marinicella sp. W31]MDC2877808.1 tripartite tricarboxylate transporter TctB family protein [Marinicella sp. W31]